MKKIAFLFLTIDDVHFPKIWEEYFQSHRDYISIYCHPKNPENVTVPWLKKNIISNLVETGWGYIVNAYRELLTEAFKDKNNVKFITISESCVPIQRFSFLYRDIMHKHKLHKSHIKYMDIKSYDRRARIETQEGHDTLGIKWRKHYARFCLTRQHVKILLKENEKIDFFGRMHVGDEFFLSILGESSDIIDMAITFDNWERTEKKVSDINKQIKNLYKQSASEKKINELRVIKQDVGRNPHSYIIVSKQDVKEARDTDSFFWRKFPKNSNIEKYISYKENTSWKNIDVQYPKRKHLKIEDLDRIDYYDENDNVINILINERPEQYLANDYILPDMKVLELGARYGTVSCVINNKLENPRNHVVMEPDKTVLNALIKNRKNHESKFTIVNAIISNEPMELVLSDYGTYVKDVKDVNNNQSIIKNYTLEHIMKMMNIEFDTLVADCEGCMCKFLEENEEYVKHYRMFIIEQDLPKICNYKSVNKKLLGWGFKTIVNGFVSVWKK